MTTFMIAWHRTMRTPATTSTERERAFLLVCQRSLVFIRTHMHRGSSSKSLRHSQHLHVHGHPCGLFTLILPFYFLLYLPPLFLFLNFLKSVVNLHNSCNESMDSTDEFSLSTVHPRIATSTSVSVSSVACGGTASSWHYMISLILTALQVRLSRLQLLVGNRWDGGTPRLSPLVALPCRCV